MNTGQTMLIIAALSLLSTLTLNINASLMNASVFGYNMEVNLDAISIAQSMLDEVLFNDYDQKTITKRAFSYSEISATLGPESGETISGVDSSWTGDYKSKTKFNDVDDYNGYTRLARSTRLGLFNVSVTVKYVVEGSPDQISMTPTFYKRVTVTVTHPNMITDNQGNIVPMVMKDLSIYRRYF